MGKQCSKKKNSRYLGIYTLANGQSAFGELRLKGANTLLKLHADQVLSAEAFDSGVKGIANTGERLTLIDCVSPSTGSTYSEGDPIKYHADVFPHYVAIGRHHLKSDQPYVDSIHFTTTDLKALFYDFDAFGQVTDAKTIIDSVLLERRRMRPVESGEHPIVAYFTGKHCIADVPTAIGRVSVHHQPSYSMGGPSGVSIKNRIVVTIEPTHPVMFSEAIARMYEVAGFLSMAAGRRQGVDKIQISTTEILDDMPCSLSIYPSYHRGARGKDEQHKPHPGDVPLDPIRHPTEFNEVFSDWIGRHSSWRVARSRYLGCLQKGNKYGTERLIAAANMFDILPIAAVPVPSELSAELIATRDQCKVLFRKHPAGIDRNSALDALGRLGKPSLPKKVAHRASIVDSKLGGRFPDLQFLASVAVKCRNYFVHGSSGDIDYQKVESFLPFLTDSLEFIFAASDFIEAGWDAQRWVTNLHGDGHSFARFSHGYSITLAELRRVTASV